jgi:lincosamide nucleotidyltransferase A/C/D/E
VTAADVLDVLDRLEQAGVEAWLDGGWGVDALVGEQTRTHSDLDLVVPRDDLPKAQEVLAKQGFAHAAEERPGLPARLVLRDGRGRQIDFHPIILDEEGNGRQDLGEGRFGLYPADGLKGVGQIGDRRLRCITPELQLGHHRGYKLPDHERRDIELLAERFGLK